VQVLPSALNTEILFNKLLLLQDYHSGFTNKNQDPSAGLSNPDASVPLSLTLVQMKATHYAKLNYCQP
jgi:hypothetical protein